MHTPAKPVEKAAAQIVELVGNIQCEHHLNYQETVWALTQALQALNERQRQYLTAIGERPAA